VPEPLKDQWRRFEEREKGSWERAWRILSPFTYAAAKAPAAARAAADWLKGAGLVLVGALVLVALASKRR
jgi:hypothetical protein